jgi:Fe-S cluster assembly iron-binding protein IscA
MFMLTPSAAAILAETRLQNGLPDDVAIRISGGGSSNGSAAAYRVSFANVPWPDDLVVQSEGTRLFVAADVAGGLETAALDVEGTADGHRLIVKHNR